MASRPFWRDVAFAIALLAGVVCWIALWLVGQPLAGPPAWLLLAQLVFLMPVLEEIVFRGGIQAALQTKRPFQSQLCGISVANVLTSVVFASMHLISQPPLWAVLVFFPSLVFGWAKDRYNSIVPSVILHAFYNAGFVWLFVAPA